MTYEKMQNNEIKIKEKMKEKMGKLGSPWQNSILVFCFFPLSIEVVYFKMVCLYFASKI